MSALYFSPALAEAHQDGNCHGKERVPSLKASSPLKSALSCDHNKESSHLCTPRQGRTRRREIRRRSLYALRTRRAARRLRILKYAHTCNNVVARHIDFTDSGASNSFTCTLYYPSVSQHQADASFLGSTPSGFLVLLLT
eukprot:1824226-Amphidinium_carterae.1